MRHLMSPLDLSVDELNTLLDLASDIEKHPDKYAHVCDDKRLATLFYEPSTCLLYTSITQEKFVNISFNNLFQQDHCGISILL